MPGRGEPWKKGGLIDNTVIEDDLAPSLKTKVNTGGVTVDQACIVDEFHAVTLQALNERYNLTGTFLQTFGQKYGVVEMDSGSISVEGAGQIHTQNTFVVDAGAGDSSCALVPIPESNIQFHFYGFSSNNLGSVVEIIGLSSQDMYGFIHDPSINNNWQAIAKELGGSETVVDTGVAITTTRNKLEAEHDFDAGTITYKIAGVQVAVISTNLPSGLMFLNAYASNVVATQRSMFIDFWSGSAERL